MLDRAGAVPDLSADGVTLVDDFLHLLFDQAKVFGGEGFLAVKVIVPAVLDDGADGDLGIGPQVLHGAGHDVGKVVAYQLVRLRFVSHGVDRDVGICVDRPGQIKMRTVHGGADRFFAKRFGDVVGHVARSDTCVVLTCVAIGKGEGDLGHSGLLVGLAPTRRPVAGYMRPACLASVVGLVNIAVGSFPWRPLAIDCRGLPRSDGTGRYAR